MFRVCFGGVRFFSSPVGRDKFLALACKACGVESCDGSSLVDEVVIDDLSRAELLEALKVSFGAVLKEKDLMSESSGTTMADLYKRLLEKGLVQEEKTTSVRENLYFRRLLQGVDVSIKPTTPVQQLTFQVAKQMRNFSYVIGDKKIKEVVVVDACWDVEGILGFIKAEGLKCVGAICTHYHWDHVGGELPLELLARLGVPPAVQPMVRILPGVKELMAAVGKGGIAYMHEKDAETIIQQTKIPKDQVHVTKHQEVFKIGDMAVRVLHTPGHTPGSQCLLLENFSPMRVLTGDTLFVGSFGRIDNEDCSASDLWESLNVTLGALPDDTIVFPAHDYSEVPTSSIGQERKTNPAMRIPKQHFVASYGSKY